MEKLLLQLKSLFAKGPQAFSVALMLIALFGFGNKSLAQVYYVTNDANANTLVTEDALNRMDYDGSNNIRMVGSFANSPTNIEQDLANGRLFVYEALGTAKSIKVVNATNGSIINSISVPYNVSSMRYDAATDYIYFTTTSGGVALDVSDALYKVRPTETTPTLIASSITTSPLNLALDIPNNRVFIYESVTANRGIKTFDLVSRTITQSATINAGTVVDIAYDATSGYIYYLTNDGTASVTSANDALSKILPGANSSIVIKSSMSTSPSQCLLLDVGNNRAYFYEGLTASRAIKAVNLTSGDVTTVYTLPATPGTTRVSGMASARVATVMTSNVSATGTTAIVGGSIIRTDLSVIDRGVVYSSTESLPTIANATKTSLGTGSGSFTGTISGLSSATTYNMRAYATSAAGTAYGDVVTVVTKSSDATLSNIVVGNGTLNPSFSTNTTNYTVSVPNSQTSLNLTATVNQPNATFKVSGASIASGQNISYNLYVGTNNINYVVTAQDGITTKTYTIVATRAKTDQTITLASTASKTYGDADYSPGATASSGATVTYSSSNTAVATIVSNNVHIVGVGTATITASQAGNTSYNAAPNVTQTLTIAAKPITVTANANQTKVYGNADPTFTYTAPGVLSGDNPTGALARDAGTTVGVYAINVGTLSYGSKYTVTFVPANFSITKRPLTVAPLPVTKIYGQTDFANGAPYSLNGTSLASGDAGTGSFGRDNTSEDVGVYNLTIGAKHPVKASTGEDMSSNYDISFVSNTFTITAKPVTVTANSNQSKAYGAADPTLTYTSTGLAFSDQFSGSLSRAAGENVGNYAITQGSFTAGSNYNLTFTNGVNFAITPANITVTANANQSKIYGDADPAFTYSVTSGAVVAGDSFTGALSRAAGETVGAYAISQGSLALNSNYNLTFTSADFAIAPKVINVTAQASGKTYGDTDPALSYTADALSAGDSFSGSIRRHAGETAGNYVINQGTLTANANYTINFTNSTFTIAKRDITISPLQVNEQYGNADVNIGYSYTGSLVAPDAFTGALSRTPGTAIGSYPVTLGTLAVNSNYNLILNAANYNIGKRVIQINTPNTTKIYGDADPVFTYAIQSGSLLNGAQITGAPERNAGESAGPYWLTKGTLTINDSNYDLQYSGGYFEILPAPLTVKADDKSKYAGLENPPLTYTINGFKNGDTQASFTSPITISTTATAASPEGTYPINVGSANTLSINYDATFTPGTLTVNALSADATLSNLTTNLGTLTPSFDPNTTNYEVSVGEGVTSIYVTPTVNSAYASVKVNYSSVTSGSPSSVYISPGDNPIPVLVTAQDGTTKQYNLNVKAPLSNNAKLAGIYYFIGDNFSSVPGFDPEVHSYTLNLTNDITSARLIPFGEDYNARITVNGSPYDGYFTPYLNGGANVFTFVVASQDGTTTETYTLTINRALSANNNLAALSIDHGSLSPIFNAGVTLYTAAVPSTVYSLNLTASVADTTARVKVNNESFVNYASKNINLQGGNNTITTTVTAANGDTKDYVIVVTKALSSDATLSNLTTNAGALSPGFSSGTSVYSQTAPATRSTIDVTPTANAATTTIMVNGITAVSGNAVSVPVSYGANTIAIVATAEDGTTATYTIAVNRPLPATDPSISLSISPVFPLTATTGPANENYKTIVSPSVSSISVVPVSANGKATVTVNGTQVSSGSPSGQIATPYGTTLITVNSVAEDGVAAKSYSISVTRYLSSKAILSYIETTPKLLLERQSDVPALAIYNGTVGASVSSINIKPTLQDTTARMTINGVPAADKQYSSPFDLVAGNNVIDIKVTAANGVTTKIYRLNITRAISNPPVITTIETDPKVTLALQSNTDTLSVYTATVSSATSTIRVKPTAGGTASGVTVNGVATADGTFSAPVALVAGNNVINLIVTAADNATAKTYRLNITRTLSPTPVLATIETDPKVSLALQSSTDALYIYNATVGAGTTSIKIKPTLKGAALGITVNGTTTADATYSAPVALVAGNNVIDVKVTAIDGSTNRIYRLNVTRSVSAPPVLATIETNPKVSLALQSNTDTLSVYNATVGVAVSSISVKPTLKSAATGITVNGLANADATYSSPVSLVPGSNVIDIKVTALDGVTTKTYRLNINRTIAATPILATIEIDPKVALKLQSRNSTLSIYTATVAGGVSSIRIKPTLKDTGPAIDINGTLESNAVLSSPVALSVGANTIDIKLTAADGITTNTYRLNITRQTPSSNADLAAAEISQYVYPNSVGTPVTLTETSPGIFSGKIYASSFPFTIRYKTTSSSANATISMFGFINLPNGQYADITTNFPNYDSVSMPVTVKAEDGVTTRNYILQITVAPPPQNLAGNRDAIRMVSKTNNSFVATDDVVVHPGVSPNGDGTNDFLVIEGLSNTTSNKLAIMNAAGTLVYETKDYGKDGSNVFNGRARNGSMLQAGTYYYALEYQVGKETKRKTGYLVLKY